MLLTVLEDKATLGSDLSAIYGVLAGRVMCALERMRYSFFVFTWITTLPGKRKALNPGFGQSPMSRRLCYCQVMSFTPVFFLMDSLQSIFM